MADEKQPEKKKTYKVSSTYEVSGDSLKRKGSNCPKCGEGYRMASHKDRKACGRCGYTVFGD